MPSKPLVPKGVKPCWAQNRETGEWEQWFQNSRAEVQQSEEATRRVEIQELVWSKNRETGEWEQWVRNAWTGEWEQVEQSDEAAQRVEAPKPVWSKNRETGEWEQWVRNARTGEWEQVEHADELARSEVDVDVQETSGSGDASAWRQGSWEEQSGDDDGEAEALGRETHARDVYADDEESGALEVFATSQVPASGGDARLLSFLASVGPEFDAVFVEKHTGASKYEDLITFIETKEDLEPLVEAGMTPLQRNKLFRAILKEREQPAH